VVVCRNSCAADASAAASAASSAGVATVKVLAKLEEQHDCTPIEVPAPATVRALRQALRHSFGSEALTRFVRKSGSSDNLSDDAYVGPGKYQLVRPPASAAAAAAAAAPVITKNRFHRLLCFTSRGLLLLIGLTDLLCS